MDVCAVKCVNGEHREAINSLTSAPMRFGCQMSYEKALGFRSSLGFGSDDRGPAVAQHTGIFHRRPGNCLASPRCTHSRRGPGGGHTHPSLKLARPHPGDTARTPIIGPTAKTSRTHTRTQTATRVRATTPAVHKGQRWREPSSGDRAQPCASPGPGTPGQVALPPSRPPALPPAQAAPGRGGRDRTEGRGRAGLGWAASGFLLSGPWRGKEKARQVGTELAPPLGAGALGAWPDLPLDV